MDITLSMMNADGTKSTVTALNKDGTVKVVPTATVDNQPIPAKAIPLVLPLADPDFIPSDVPFNGQRRSAGEHLFEVSLKGEPQYHVFAYDRLQAIERYNVKCGIITTTNPHSVNQLD